ncbi:MAG: glycosyltransferase family 2 protein [Hoeflea sp.]|uniref:glycosyltransferase family 2 protein n=1 Tax=Hoeflea sp. TaxID=1940281 RepID=UPI003EF60F79
MTQPLFTVLLPVHRPPHLLAFAVRSVLAQSVQDFELYIVCDGAPEETIRYAHELADADARIRAFTFPKGERHGEAHRHTVLEGARSRFVAQLGDDDFWFPDHLSELAALLETCDFGHLLQAEIRPEGGVHLHVADLADPTTQTSMLKEKWNFFGPSTAGYSLEAYRSLPVGWSPAPQTIWTDLYMWRKFLAQEQLTFGTRLTVQCIKPSASERVEMSLEERRAETELLVEKYASSAARQDFHTCCNVMLVDHFKQINARNQENFQAQHQQMEASRDAWQQAHDRVVNSLSWKVTAPLRSATQKLKKFTRLFSPALGGR